MSLWASLVESLAAWLKGIAEPTHHLLSDIGDDLAIWAQERGARPL